MGGMHMTRQRRGGIAILLAILLMVPATAATAQTTADFDDASATILRSEITPVIKGTGSWVALTVRADKGDLVDVEITAESRKRGTEVSYPTNTADHTSFFTDSTLTAGEIDYFAFFLDVDEDAPGNNTSIDVVIEATVDGERERESFRVKVPLVRHSGADVEQVTTDLGTVTAGSTTWVEVAFTGVGPEVDEFRAVARSGELTIGYPADGDTTSLHHDDALSHGETDVIRFKIDATDAVPGTFELKLATTYRGGSLDGSLAVQVVPAG